MTVKEIMERVGITETGRAIAYIKDALEEMALLTPTHFRRMQMDITKDQRFYDIPKESMKLLHIRCKNHDNSDDTYKEIPRMIHEPEITDTDGA